MASPRVFSTCYLGAVAYPGITLSNVEFRDGSFHRQILVQPFKNGMSGRPSK